MSVTSIAIEIEDVIADGLLDYLEADSSHVTDEAQSAALVVLLKVANALPEQLVEELR